jgi:hypothetical protein
MTTIGPLRTASASQMNWPGLSVRGSVAASCEALSPQNGTAPAVETERTSVRSAASAISGR